MKEKIDFSKCLYFHEHPCLGENIENTGHAISEQVVYVKNGTPTSCDRIDFIKENHCSKCPKNKN
ncbi:MAG: hypothetical protein WBN77_02750 [Desulfobacterales bacterium]